MKTNWRDFSIGMASGIAFCFILYFAWGLISPQRPETANTIAATSNTPVGLDENALIAANAERPNNNTITPPPQLQPEPRNIVEEPRILLEPEPPVVRPRPRPQPDDDLPPPDDFDPDGDPGAKPDY